jgi:hypothetical protein
VTRNTADFEPFASLSKTAIEGEEIRLENWFDA